MRLIKTLTILAFSWALAGCGQGVYSTTVAGDGSVIIVNKLTGTAQRVQGDLLVPLRAPPEPAAQNYRPKLDDRTIPNQPIDVAAVAEYRNGSMLVKVSMRPNKKNMTPDEWTTWRKHIADCRTDATVNLKFIDGNGFDVITREAPLSEMARLMDASGAFIGLHTQLSLALARDDYNSITSWYMGWSNWQSCSAVPLDDLPNNLRDAKKGAEIAK